MDESDILIQQTIDEEEEFLKQLEREESYEVGCGSCGEILLACDAHEGFLCPSCGSAELLTFNEAIAEVVDQRNFFRATWAGDMGYDD